MGSFWNAGERFRRTRVKIGSRVAEQQWRHMKAKFDSDAEKWEDVCSARRESARKRWRGKAPRGEGEREMQKMQMHNLHLEPAPCDAKDANAYNNNENKNNNCSVKGGVRGRFAIPLPQADRSTFCCGGGEGRRRGFGAPAPLGGWGIKISAPPFKPPKLEDVQGYTLQPGYGNFNAPGDSAKAEFPRFAEVCACFSSA